MKKIISEFFKETDYLNLSICRIFYYLYICYLHISLYGWLNFSKFPSALYSTNGIYNLFNIGPLDHITYLVIFYISLLFCFLSAIGFLGRLSFIISLLGFTLLNSLPQLYQTLVGLNVMHVFVLLIFCFTQANRFISVDYFLNKRFSQNHPKVSADYNWPIHYFRYLYVVCVFFAGLSKLYSSGLTWFQSDHLLNEILCSPLIRKETAFNWPAQFYQQISQVPQIFSIGAFLVILVELASPFALFNKKIRYIFLAIMLFMHLISYLLLFINPIQFMGLYIFWIDWQKIKLWRPQKVN